MDGEAKKVLNDYWKIRNKRRPWWKKNKFKIAMAYAGVGVLFALIFFGLKCDENVGRFLRKREMTLTGEEMAQYYALKDIARELIAQRSRVETYVYFLNKYPDRQRREDLGYSEEQFRNWNKEYVKQAKILNQKLKESSYNSQMALVPILADSQDMPKGLDPLPLSFMPYLITTEQEELYGEKK